MGANLNSLTPGRLGHIVCNYRLLMRRGELERGIALEAAKQGIATRIRRVCEHFSESEFAALVSRMAEIEVRYRLRDEWLFYREMVRQPPTARQ